MSNIEQFVPIRELCQRARALGWKKETFFLWYNDDVSRISIEQTTPNALEYCLAFAPMVQEILEELDKEKEDGIISIDKVNGEWGVAKRVKEPKISVMVIRPSLADAALELWCELEERKLQLQKTT